MDIIPFLFSKKGINDIIPSMPGQEIIAKSNLILIKESTRFFWEADYILYRQNVDDL